MSTLTTLIKLAEKKLEAIQQAITKIDIETAALTAMQRELAAQVKQSFHLAEIGQSSENFRDAHAFQDRAIEEDLALQARVEELVAQKNTHLAQMRDVFAEKKRYEILAEREAITAKKNREKKAQEQLDDLTAQRR